MAQTDGQILSSLKVGLFWELLDLQIWVANHKLIAR